MDTLVAPLDPTFVDVGGRRIEVFETGTTRGPVVILLTGAGDTARSWLPLQADLARTTRVVAYERSGIGASTPGSPRTIDGLVAELEGVVAALAPDDPVVLVGHSFGALIARVYAARHPDRTAGLVMLDATPDRLAADPLRRRGYRLYVEGIAVARWMLPAPLFARLVRRNALPLYPGRTRFLAALSPRAREEWHRAVTALFLGDAVDEMRAVLPGTAAAAGEIARTADAALPVAIFTSGTYGRGWVTMHDAIARRYPNATHRLSGDRFHNVHMRHVTPIAHAVRAMIDPVANDRSER